ncbi:MAG: SdpI family protein [Pseudomonadota bacterium]
MTKTTSSTLPYDIAAILLVAAGLLLSFLLYDQLPDPMPTHFNVHGEADDWTSQPWGAILMPLIALATYAVMRILPGISPKNFAMEAFTNPFYKVCVMITALVVALHIMLIWQLSQGQPGLTSTQVVAAIAVLFIGIGNYINKATRNFFFGIRTPWALASDEVWAKTNRFGGWAFSLFGVCALVFSVTLSGATLVVTTISVGVILIVAIIAYSYVVHRRFEN